MRVGALTPLLGAFVVLDLLFFWQAAWVSREVIAVTGVTLMTITAFAGAYYLAAALVFPRAVDETTDLDLHFFRVRRLVIGVMLLLLIAQLAFYLATPSLAVRLEPSRAWAGARAGGFDDRGHARARPRLVPAGHDRARRPVRRGLSALRSRTRAGRTAAREAG